MSFVDDRHRLNVAFTRAIKKLIVIGNAKSVLDADFLPKYLKYCKDINGYYDFDLDSDSRSQKTDGPKPSSDIQDFLIENSTKEIVPAQIFSNPSEKVPCPFCSAKVRRKRFDNHINNSHPTKKGTAIPPEKGTKNETKNVGPPITQPRKPIAPLPPKSESFEAAKERSVSYLLRVYMWPVSKIAAYTGIPPEEVSKIKNRLESGTAPTKQETSVPVLDRSKILQSKTTPENTQPVFSVHQKILDILSPGKSVSRETLIRTHNIPLETLKAEIATLKSTGKYTLECSVGYCFETKMADEWYTLKTKGFPQKKTGENDSNRKDKGPSSQPPAPKPPLPKPPKNKPDSGIYYGNSSQGLYAAYIRRSGQAGTDRAGQW